MSKDWDVEKYRNQYEPEEQWELKKKFMEAHKDTFPEERVVCLAQVLVNVEFLGTKYPDETMRTVAGLAEDIIGEFRERQKNRLQRTFVGAADAASAKVQGRNFTKTNTLSHTSEKSSVASQSERTKDGKRKLIMAHEEGEPILEGKKMKKNKANSHDGGADKRADKKAIAGPQHSQQSLSSTGRKNRPYTNPKFILTYFQRDLDKTPFPFTSVVRDSARLANIRLETSAHHDEANKTWVSSVIFDGVVIATGTGEQKASLRSAFEKSFELLKARHCHLVIEDPEATSVFGVLTDAQDELEMMESGLKKDTVSKTAINSSNDESKPASEGTGQSSVALKMMKMMGWTAGSGLGAQKQGITQPIQADVMIGRSGFGSKTDPEFKNAIRTKLQEYLSSNALYKLTFTNEFTPEQRAIIHELARSLGLKTKSAGNKSNRVLTVRRPGSAGVPEVYPIVQKLKEMKEAHPLFTKARLIPPSNV